MVKICSEESQRHYALTLIQGFWERNKPWPARIPTISRVRGRVFCYSCDSCDHLCDPYIFALWPVLDRTLLVPSHGVLIASSLATMALCKHMGLLVSPSWSYSQTALKQSPISKFDIKRA